MSKKENNKELEFLENYKVIANSSNNFSYCISYLFVL